MSDSSSVPKAALYYYPTSIWCSAALLALEEKGYGEDEVDLKFVDLATGENYALSFLRLNPNATVPTLVVPFEKTLAADVDSRYKAVTETKAIIEMLDKSRSAVSRTHTTSAAPAPALTPATIAFSAISTTIIDLLHSEDGDPNNAKYLNARDEASLKALSKESGPFFFARRDALANYISESEKGSIQASAKTRKFWQEKKMATDVFADIFAEGEKSDGELSPDGKRQRADYFQKAKNAWQVGLKNILVKVNQEIIGPFALGDQLSIADIHLAAWLARLVSLAGGTASDAGDVAISKLEKHIGPGFALPKDFQSATVQRNGGEEVERPVVQSKIAAFWDAVKERPSWKKVYAQELH